MAQAGIALAKVPLASPQPTAPPHPRDLARKLYQRELSAETCGWIDGQPNQPEECALGSLCAYNTDFNAAFCCDSSSFPSSCTYATTCFDSTEVPYSCTSGCLDDPAVDKCTLGGLDYCVTKYFDYGTGWDCGSEPSEALVVYPEYYYGALLSEGAYFSSSVAASAVASSALASMDPIGPPLSSSEGSTSTLSPTTTSTTPPAATVTAAPVPSPRRGLPGGAIAGIVVGVVLLLVIALGMILLYRYFKGRKRPPPPSQQLIRDTTTQPTSMAAVQPGSPTLSNPASMPSNAPLYSPAMNELSPEETKVGSYQTSHSALGAPPQFSAQHGGQPPPSPRTEFGSMAPVHAPDGNSEYTFVPKGPQQ